MTVYGISGGPIEQFREGWAIVPFVLKPHYWKREGLTRVYHALCGVSVGPTHPGVGPLAPGVFMIERCKRCAKAHDRAVRAIGCTAHTTRADQPNGG